MKNTVNEPLKHYVQKHGVDIANIDQIVCGRKYSAVLLKSGNIGVCANLDNHVEIEIEELKSPDLKRIQHRIILNAYFNGMFNYLNHYEKTGDIFEDVDFQCYMNIVMIGLFKPLLAKFHRHHIQINVFDMIREHDELLPIKNEMKYIKKADAIILSATSIFNDTFMDIVTHTGENCDIFLLGPSSIMDKDMFRYKNIKKIFGSIFKPGDQNVLDAIRNGFGTKKYIKYGRKVSLALSP
ncbi:MAG: DUF364 domain-containing protein [Candidatus Aminicenantes bacterium]|jgi:uncharacterized protein (DUF4213/DUF364 family)